MATHPSILAWEIPWTEEPGGLQSMGSQRVDTTERLSTHIHIQPNKLTKEDVSELKDKIYLDKFVLFIQLSVLSSGDSRKWNKQPTPKFKVAPEGTPSLCRWENRHQGLLMKLWNSLTFSSWFLSTNRSAIPFTSLSAFSICILNVKVFENTVGLYRVVNFRRVVLELLFNELFKRWKYHIQQFQKGVLIVDRFSLMTSTIGRLSLWLSVFRM